MNVIRFIVERRTTGGLHAEALDHPIFIQAETLDELRDKARAAVHKHFDETEPPADIRFLMKSAVADPPTRH